MRVSNPAMNTNTFANFRDTLHESQQERANHMTVQGTVNKTGVLLILVAAAFAGSWNLALYKGFEIMGPMLLVGGIGGTAVAFFTFFKQKYVPYTAPIYAVLEGVFLGGISLMAELQFPGVPFWAVVGTFSVLFSMLALYKFRIIKVTERFRSVIGTAMMGILLLYLVQLGFNLFGSSIPMIFSNGLMGIGVSVLIVGVASFRLVLDFDFIAKGAEAQAPKYMEWYGAFALTIGLVWLYMELLRLLSLLSSRD